VNSLKPTTLLVTTSRWVPTARLGMALAQAGFNVDVVCPSSHPIDRTSIVRHRYSYSGLFPAQAISKAISASSPEILIPCDDLATTHLHEIYATEVGSPSVRNLIARSLGPPSSFGICRDRSAFIQMAASEGLRVPATSMLLDTGAFRNWIAAHDLPAVLKSNGSTGGEGVRVARTAEDGARAFDKLSAPPLLARALKRALLDRDTTSIPPYIRGIRPGVCAQEFIVGREATSLIACHDGKILAALHFEVLNKVHAAGPASVLRLIDNVDMSRAAEKIANRLALSGLHGFDFMLEGNTAHAYLIEMNPRATQVGHLMLGPGRDLPAALYAAVTGSPIQTADKATDKNVIALFPGEWNRDPESHFLKSAYHDIPWSEPELIRFCLRKQDATAWSNQQKKQMQTLASIESPSAE
jgi:hypothetical protein